MAEAKYTINAEIREKKGKDYSEKLRAEGKLPAVIYGPEVKENIMIELDYNEFIKLFESAGKHHVVDVKVGKKSYHCIVKDYKIHPLTRFFLHADFLAVSETKPFVTEVPLNYVGIPVGVKEGGTKFVFKKKVKISTLLKDLPVQIDVDITHLQRKQYMIVRDIKPQGDFKIMTHEGDVLLEIK